MEKYQVAAYYFANYHPGDLRNAIVHGQGWSEWDVVQRAADFLRKGVPAIVHLPAPPSVCGVLRTPGNAQRARGFTSR